MPASNIHIAVLVRMFPNIVQTYVLNHILSLKKAGVHTVILAERNPEQAEVHPHVARYHLLSETRYISTEAVGMKDFFLSLRFLKSRYFVNLPRLIFSSIWLKHGVKYTLKSVVRLAAKNEFFNVMHSHSLFSSYDYLFLRQVFSIPLTTTFHGLVPKDVSMLEDKKIRAVLNSGDAFFVNTHFAEAQLMSLGCSREKIHIIPQGTNMEDFPFVDRKISNDSAMTILSVGRLSVEKGFHVAIDAIAHIKDQFPNIEYHIIGGGLEEDNLREQIQRLGLQNNVRIFGAVSTAELQAHYRKAHIFILPSIDFKDGTHTETQGVVLQEAQSSGMPVIASRTGGIPEVISDGETGLLFAETDHVDLAGKITRLILEPEFYEKLRLAGREDVEKNYDINVICDRLISIYQKLLN